MYEYKEVLIKLQKFLESNASSLEEMEVDGYILDCISDIEFYIEQNTPTAEDLDIMAAEHAEDARNER